MSLTALEAKLLNAANVAIDAAANLVAAKNPAYEPLIVLASGLADQLNQTVNPTAAPAAQQIAAAATAISTAVAPVTSAVSTVASSSSSATQKASAAGIILGDAESLAQKLTALF